MDEGVLPLELLFPVEPVPEEGGVVLELLLPVDPLVPEVLEPLEPLVLLFPEPVLPLLGVFPVEGVMLGELTLFVLEMLPELELFPVVEELPDLSYVEEEELFPVEPLLVEGVVLELLLEVLVPWSLSEPLLVPPWCAQPTSAAAANAAIRYFFIAFSIFRTVFGELNCGLNIDCLFSSHKGDFPCRIGRETPNLISPAKVPDLIPSSKRRGRKDNGNKE